MSNNDLTCLIAAIALIAFCALFGPSKARATTRQTTCRYDTSDLQKISPLVNVDVYKLRHMSDDEVDRLLRSHGLSTSSWQMQ